MSCNIATFTVSLDFELAWGSPNKWNNPSYIKNVIAARRAAELLLELLHHHEIHATWAMVGAMFTHDYDELISIASDFSPPLYSDRILSPFLDLDRIKNLDSKALYMPEFYKKLEMIKGQEVASHTFSHYYCLEEGSTKESFQTDLDCMELVCNERKINIRSIVLPRNQVNSKYYESILAAGISNIRGDASDGWLWKSSSRRERSTLKRLMRIVDGYIPISTCPKNQGICLSNKPDVNTYPKINNYPASRFYRANFDGDRLLRKFKVNKILSEIDSCVSSKSNYHLWFHPENLVPDVEGNLEILNIIFAHVNKLVGRGELKSATMSELLI